MDSQSEQLQQQDLSNLPKTSPGILQTHRDFRPLILKCILFAFYSAEEEAGAAIIDVTTAPRQQLLSMLQSKQGLTSRATQAPSTAQLQPQVKQSPGTATLHGQPGISLSELSVHDPGMKDPQAWLLTVQKVGLVCHDEAACCQKDLQSV